MEQLKVKKTAIAKTDATRDEYVVFHLKLLITHPEQSVVLDGI